jgi:Na+-driven multidrug efflux pump
VPVGISIFCIIAVQLPAAYLLDARLGLEGVWMAFPLTYLSMLALQTAYYRGVWRHRKIERLV